MPRGSRTPALREAYSGDYANELGAIARKVNGLLAGLANDHDAVTLASDGVATTTQVGEPDCLPDSIVTLHPTTASAAAELPTLYVTTAVGAFTLHHTASVTSDRTYRYRLGV